MRVALPDDSQGYVALASVDKATLQLSFVPRRTTAIHEVAGLVREVLGDAGRPHDADYAARRTGKRLLRGDYGRVEVVPWDRGGFGILATPDPEYLVPSPAATILDQYAGLVMVGAALAEEGVTHRPVDVTLRSMTPFVDVAACPLLLEHLSALPGLTSRVTDRHVDESRRVTSLLAYGLRAYNKSHQVQTNPKHAYVLELYSKAGVPLEHHPVIRLEPAGTPSRAPAGYAWPPDLGALHRDPVIRFLRLASGHPLGSPSLDRLLASPPLPEILSAQFPKLDLPARRPTMTRWSMEEGFRHARSYAPLVVSELLARRGLAASSLAEGFRMLGESPDLADPRLERAFQRKLRIARTRYSSGHDGPPTTPEA